MNHIEEQINDCVAGIESLIYNIEMFGRSYRLTPAEVKLVYVVRTMIKEVKDERIKQQEFCEEHNILGLPLERYNTTTRVAGADEEVEG